MEDIKRFIERTEFREVVFEFRDANNERCGGYKYKVSHKLSRDEIIEQVVELLKQMHREGWELYYQEKGKYQPYPAVFGHKYNTDVWHFSLVLK